MPLPANFSPKLNPTSTKFRLFVHICAGNMSDNCSISYALDKRDKLFVRTSAIHLYYGSTQHFTKLNTSIINSILEKFSTDLCNISGGLIKYHQIYLESRYTKEILLSLHVAHDAYLIFLSDLAKAEQNYTHEHSFTHLHIFLKSQGFDKIMLLENASIAEFCKIEEKIITFL